MSTSETWAEVCELDDIDEEDVLGFDHDGRTFAIYRSSDGSFHATDGLCTHERAHLADGLVMGNIIECPKHNGQFNYKTGTATRRPACLDLNTYRVRIDAGQVLLGLD